MELRIPFVTLLKITLTILLIVSVVKLWPVILMLIIAVLVAVMLDPIVVWLERFGVRRSFTIALIAVVVFGLLIGFFAFIVPPMTRQLVEFSRELPRIRERVVASVPPLAPYLPSPQRMTKGQPAAVAPQRALQAGMQAAEGTTALLFVLVVSMYLLVEGRRAFAWLASFAPADQRQKVHRTAREMNGVVLAFMRGNVLTSCICAAFVYVTMGAMHIPMPLLLATIAFVADFVPVVGTIVMILPGALLALMVSPMRALGVVGVYLLYHVIENYLIIPRVYGTQMRLSTLTVLVAIAIGGTLQGVIGAVLALPIAAAYPIVERIWLREHLPEDTVARHQAIAAK